MNNSSLFRISFRLIILLQIALLSACAINTQNASNPGQIITNNLLNPDDVFKIKKEYSTHSLKYMPVRKPIYNGQFSEAIQIYQTSGPKENSNGACEEAGDKKVVLRRGTCKANLNVRNAPNGKKVGVLSNGDTVSILEEQNGWFHIQREGANGEAIEGWSSASYIEETQIEAGNGTLIIDLNAKTMKVLHNMELGVLNLDAGNTQASREHIQVCLDELRMESKTGLFFDKFINFFRIAASVLLGNPGLKSYDPPGYEKVMLLDYKSLDYLLNGDRKAFNVARMAIDWQNAERKEFEKELAKIKAKREKQKAKEEKSSCTGTDVLPENTKQIKALESLFGSKNGEAKPAEQGESSSAGEKAADADQESLLSLSENLGKLESLFAYEYSDTHEIAKRADSAYVNPFVDYLNGLIMEYDSYDDANKIDDAKKAYEKASKLNPKSKMLQKAAEDMGRAYEAGQVNKNKKMLHVVVAEGFAPEVKVISTVVPIPPNKLISVKLPKREPLPSKVKTVKILTSNDKILATLDVVADMDAMVLRHQMDSEDGIYLVAGALVMRSFAGQTVAEKYFGDVGSIVAGMVLNGTSEPETRSWVSLPKTIRAARLPMPSGLTSLKIASYDAKGHQLAVKTVKVTPNAHNFVYGRSVNSLLTVQAGENLWVNKK